MTRTKLTLATLTVLGALALASTAFAAPPKLTGTVGPGFTITLTQNGKAVKTLPAGSYVFAVSDKSNIHNFRVKGPGGVNKEITTVPFQGSKSVTLTLKKGHYSLVCNLPGHYKGGQFVDFYVR